MYSTKYSYLLSFIKILNPDYPEEWLENKPFPNDLKLFDISSCYQIAVEINNIITNYNNNKNNTNKYNLNGSFNLSYFGDLKNLRNDFIHSKIGDLEKIKNTIKYFCKNDAELNEKIEEQIFQIQLITLKDVGSFEYENYKKIMLENEQKMKGKFSQNLNFL